MAYKLHNGIYMVRCHYPQCTYNVRLEIEAIIMGVTTLDVETEARRAALEKAQVQHDALHGRHHPLTHPEIRKVTGNFERIGALQEQLF